MFNLLPGSGAMGLVGAFSIDGRAGGGDLRAALKEAAPHAFKSASSPRQSAHEPQMRARSAGPRAEGAAALSAKPKEDWTEF